MATCPQCGQPRSVWTRGLFAPDQGYISLSTLLELILVVAFVFALFRWDFRSAFIETCSLFVAILVSGLFLFILYCYWAAYKYDSIQRARSRTEALRWALFRAVAGVIFGACVAAISVSLNSKNVRRLVVDELNTKAETNPTQFWIWVAIGALVGLVWGVAMIWTAHKAGPAAAPLPEQAGRFSRGQ